MRKDSLKTTIAIFLTILPTAYAQDNEDEVSTSIPSELASPWTTDARPWLIGGAASTALLIILEDQVVDPTQKDLADDRPLGKFSKLGDYGGQFYPNAIYSLGMATYGLFGKDKIAIERSLLMLKASAYSISITSALKIAVREPRPNDGNDKKSFTSGHATSAVAFGSFIWAEHGWIAGLPAMGLATLTGLSRINDNKHYLHDVIGGATIGAAYGIGVSFLHQKARKADDKKMSKMTFQFVPIFDSGMKGAALVGEF